MGRSMRTRLCRRISIFNPYTGLLNSLLMRMGLPGQMWIYSPTQVIPCLAIMAASFVARRYVSVNILVIILLCALIGAGDTWVRGRREAKI